MSSRVFPDWPVRLCPSSASLRRRRSAGSRSPQRCGTETKHPNNLFVYCIGKIKFEISGYLVVGHGRHDPPVEPVGLPAVGAGADVALAVAEVLLSPCEKKIQYFFQKKILVGKIALSVPSGGWCGTSWASCSRCTRSCASCCRRLPGWGTTAGRPRVRCTWDFEPMVRH